MKVEEHISADALPAMALRGVKKVGAAALRAIGNKSVDGSLDAMNGKQQIVDAFFSYARQQGWPKSKYTLSSVLVFWTNIYKWVPDAEGMGQIAAFAAKHFSRKLEESFHNAALILEAVSEKDIASYKKAMANPKVAGVINKASSGERLDRQDVNDVGGYERLQELLNIHETLQDEAEDQSREEFDPKRTSGSLFDIWENMIRVMPGRDTVLSRMQMDALALIVVRDMLRRGLMSRPDENGNPTATPNEAPEAPASKNRSHRINPGRNAESPSGTIISMPVFIEQMKKGSVTLATLRAIEAIGDDTFLNRTWATAAKSPSVGERRALVFLSGVAMALRLKKEARLPEDRPVDANGKHFSGRALTDHLKECGITAEDMEAFDALGENDDISVVYQRIQRFPDNKLKLIFGCFAKSMRFLDENELISAKEEL